MVKAAGDLARAQAFPPVGDEQRGNFAGGLFFTVLDVRGKEGAEIVLQEFHLGDGALPDNADVFRVQVNVGDIEVGEFLEPDAGAEEQFKDDPVAFGVAGCRLPDGFQ